MKLSRLALVLPFAALAACETTGMDPAPQPAPKTPGATVTTPVSTPATTDAAKAAAAEAVTGKVPDSLETSAAAAPAKGGKLGTTVASLGDATRGGMWVKTPLVKTAGKGRVVNPATGKSVNVELIPLGGPASAGSQVSLPALNGLGADLTDLPEIEVYSA